MPRFRYQATDDNDQPLKEGTIEAENRFVAVARLLQDGMHVTELEELEELDENEEGVGEVLEPQPSRMEGAHDNTPVTRRQQFVVTAGLNHPPIVDDDDAVGGSDR